MAYPTSFCDSALSADVVRDANPTIQFTKIKSFERYALLRLLACLVPLTGLILGLMPVDPKPGDPMPVDPIQAINRYGEDTQIMDEERQLFVLVEKNPLKTPRDFEEFTEIMQSFARNRVVIKRLENYEKWRLFYERTSTSVLCLILIVVSLIVLKGGINCIKSWCSKEGRMMLRISESLSQDDTLYLSGGDSQPPVAAIEECKLLLQSPLKVNQPQQWATPSFSQQNPQQWQHGQQPAIKKEPEDRTSSATSGLTVGPERPKWYHEAVQNKGVAYAEMIWENEVQGMREDEVRKQMQEMKINERRRGVESMPSVETEPGDDKREALVTRDLRLGPIENTTRSSDHMPDLPKYKMDRSPRGMCIIFNAENFTVEHLKKRQGTQKDVEALLNTFQNNLKFKTEVKNDPTAQEYIDYLKAIGRMDHSEFDCFVCVILSHGREGRVYGKNGGEKYINALTGLFRGDRVPSLVNKPKLFFIQACQGAYPQESVDIIQQDGPTTLPYKSDILVSHATIPGYASFRNVNQGSLFIISLCNIINTNYKKVDLLSMLTMVNELMSREAIEGKWEIYKQIGNPSHCLRKQIFFNEGLTE